MSNTPKSNPDPSNERVRKQIPVSMEMGEIDDELFANSLAKFVADGIGLTSGAFETVWEGGKAVLQWLDDMTFDIDGSLDEDRKQAIRDAPSEVFVPEYIQRMKAGHGPMQGEKSPVYVDDEVATRLVGPASIEPGSSPSQDSMPDIASVPSEASLSSSSSSAAIGDTTTPVTDAAGDLVNTPTVPRPEPIEGGPDLPPPVVPVETSPLLETINDVPAMEATPEPAPEQQVLRSTAPTNFRAAQDAGAFPIDTQAFGDLPDGQSGNLTDAELEQALSGVQGDVELVEEVAEATAGPTGAAIAEVVKAHPELIQEQQEVTTRNDPLSVANRYLGLNERNKSHQDTIKGFFDKAVPNWVTDKSLVTTRNYAWCAAFAHHVLDVMGVDSGIEGFNRVRARKYAAVGVRVDGYDNAQSGDLIVRTGRNNHVGFFVGLSGPDHVLVLGGNQDNTVSVKRYHRNHFQHIRRLENVQDADPDLVASLSQDIEDGRSTR